MSTDTTPPRGDWFGRLFVALLIAACLVLSLQVVRLSRQVEQLSHKLREAINRPTAGAIAIGESMPSLITLDASGAEVLIDGVNALALREGRLGTVLIAISGTCPACQESMPIYASLAARHAGTGVVVVAIQVDAKRGGDLKAAPPDLPLAWVAGGEQTWLRRIDIVPSVLVLDATGTVRSMFKGELDADQRAQLETMLRAMADPAGSSGASGSGGGR